MLHVARDELPPRRSQQVLARELGPSTARAPSRPGAGRGSRRRRSPGRRPSAPTPGRRGSGRGASGSAAGRWNGPACAPARCRARRPSAARPRRGPRRGPRGGSVRRVRAPPPCVAVSPRKKTISAAPFGSSSSQVWSAPHGSRPAPTRPESGASRSSAAGCSSVPLRPRNSVRSPVHASCRPARSANATRSPKLVRHGLRASSAPVSGSISVATNGADAPRDGPSTHST